MKVKYRDILNGYTTEKQESDRSSHVFLFYIYRPISFPFTWLAFIFGFSANSITFASFLLTLVIPPLMISNLVFYKIIGAVAMFFFLVLDCVDGNIARVQKSDSQYGHVLDAITGFIFWIFIYASLGFSASKDFIALKSLSIYLPFFGFAIALLFLLTRLISQMFLSEKNRPTSSSFMAILKGFPDVIPIVFAISVYLSIVDVAVLIYLIYYLAALTFVMWEVVGRCKQ